MDVSRMLDATDPSPVPGCDTPQTFERRAFVRHPRALDALWQFLGLARPDLTSGHIFDLSATGIGMQLDRGFDVGVTLVVRLPSATLGWVSHLVRVRRSTEVEPGTFQIGCTFVKPLTLKQMQAHLKT